MCTAREGESATVWTKVAKEFCVRVWTVSVKAAGFQPRNVKRSGHSLFTTKDFGVVKKLFDCLPNGADPFTNFSPVNSDGVFQLSLSANGFTGLPLVRDLKRARLQELQQSAVYELNLTEPETANLRRAQLVEMLANRRVSEGTYVGIAAVYKVLVDNAHPMSIKVTPGRCGQSLIEVMFTVQKWATTFDAGQPPELSIMYGPGY